MSVTAAGEQSGIAGSDAERRAALALASELRDTGREPRVQTLWVRTAWWAPLALAATLGVAGSVVSVGAPVAGLVLVAVALVISLSELTAAAPLRRLTPARATQNVVSAPGEAPADAVTLIVTAAIDRPRRGLDRHFPGGVLRWLVGALVLVLACSIARVAGVDAGWLGWAQLPPTVALLVCLLALIDQAAATPAEEDERAAVTAALTLIAELDAVPPRRLGVAIVLAGAGGAQSAGLRTWLRRRRRRGLARSQVAILHLEPTAGEAPSWWTRDGLLVAGRMHPQLVRAASAAAAAAPGLGARPRKQRAGTAAGIARGDRWPAIAVGIGDADDGAAFALGLVRELDDELVAAAPNGDS